MSVCEANAKSWTTSISSAVILHFFAGGHIFASYGSDFENICHKVDILSSDLSSDEDGSYGHQRVARMPQEWLIWPCFVALRFLIIFPQIIEMDTGFKVLIPSCFVDVRSCPLDSGGSRYQQRRSQ